MQTESQPLPIPAQHAGKLCIVIATGPSLTPEQVERTRAADVVLCVNNAGHLAPWAAHLYACDLSWWNFHNGMAGFTGQRWTQCATAAPLWNLRRVQGYKRAGFSFDPAHIHFGGNSGFQAVNLAILLGCNPIALLGFDMMPGANGNHYFGNHPDRLRNHMAFEKWRANFADAAPGAKQRGIEIINCTTRTALDCFPRASLDDVLI